MAPCCCSQFWGWAWSWMIWMPPSEDILPMEQGCSWLMLRTPIGSIGSDGADGPLMICLKWWCDWCAIAMLNVFFFVRLMQCIWSQSARPPSQSEILFFCCGFSSFQYSDMVLCCGYPMEHILILFHIVDHWVETSWSIQKMSIFPHLPHWRS